MFIEIKTKNMKNVDGSGSKDQTSVNVSVKTETNDGFHEFTFLLISVCRYDKQEGQSSVSDGVDLTSADPAIAGRI